MFVLIHFCLQIGNYSKKLFEKVWFRTRGLVGIPMSNSIDNDNNDEIYDIQAIPLRMRRKLNHNNTEWKPEPSATNGNANTNENSNNINDNDNHNGNGNTSNNTSNNDQLSPINHHLSVFKPRKNRATKARTDPKLRGEYHVNQCKNSRFGAYMNLEHLSINEKRFGTCDQCIFNGVKCVCAYEDLPTILARALNIIF